MLSNVAACEPPRPLPDRRHIPRRSVVFRVEIPGSRDYLVAHDVGMGGMLVTSRRPFWPGQILRLRFSLPGHPRALRVTARVVDLASVPHGAGLALQFLKLAPEAREAIRTFLREQAAS